MTRNKNFNVSIFAMREYCTVCPKVIKIIMSILSTPFSVFGLRVAGTVGCRSKV